MGKQMPYEWPDGIDTEEAQQASHLPGTVAKWISFARALSGPKTNLSDKRHIFCYVQLLRTGRPCTGKAWECEGNTGIWVRISQELQVCFPQALLIRGVILFQLDSELLTLQSSSQAFGKSGKPCPHCQILPKCPVSMPWLGALARAGRQIPLPGQAQGFPGAAESLE